MIAIGRCGSSSMMEGTSALSSSVISSLVLVSSLLELSSRRLGSTEAYLICDRCSPLRVSSVSHLYGMECPTFSEKPTNLPSTSSDADGKAIWSVPVK